MLEEGEEEYLTSNKSVTSGTFAELTKLKAENEILKARLEQQQTVGSPSKISEVFVSRSVAVQEVVLEVLAGIAGTSFEELFAKVRNKELEIEKALNVNGIDYIRHR